MAVKWFPLKTLKENMVFRRNGMHCFRNYNRKQKVNITIRNINFSISILTGFASFQSTKFSTENLKGVYVSVCARVCCFCQSFL